MRSLNGLAAVHQWPIKSHPPAQLRAQLLRLEIGFVAFCFLGGCTGGILDPRGPVGASERLILFDAVGIMLLVVVPVIVATLAFAWWFRASNKKATYLANWDYSGRIEFIVWAIPALIVMFLGGVAWTSSHDLDPAKALSTDSKPIEVQVVSLDWKWLFIYPVQGVASVNQLIVPAGIPVHFSLTSASVMNAFFVPQLGSMIYTMNGMTTQLYLQADEPGEFAGLSTNYSGAGFADMAFNVRAVSPARFGSWLAAVRGTGAVLDSESYRRLAQQNTIDAPYTYGAVQPDLFNAVVMRRLAPGPGPQ